MNILIKKVNSNMFNLNTVFFIIAAFTGGMLLKRFMVIKEIIKLKAQNIQFVSETENLRTTLSTKAREFSEMHDEMFKQHATELAKNRSEHRSILEAQENESREKLRAAEEKSFNDGIRQSELRNANSNSGFTVQVRPYVMNVRDESMFFKSHSSAIGFQYQLLVNGIPCFQPHVVIEQEYKETVVDDERIKWLTEQAFKVAQLALQSTNSQDLFKFVESPLISEQTK